MRAEASPRAAPGARLKDSVTASSWPVWLMATGPTCRSTVATVDSGTSAPPRALTKILPKALSSALSSGRNCMITA
ncbi:MAG: hypothetical protein AW07_03921 [Candidatus Accumulibacter sp. SK-11]|nr:MAG: hypothetical protein AW07_03921 [Candidatus Accumulibacter sp. SK-11]